MRVTVRQPAAPGTYFTTDAFAGCKGQRIPYDFGSTTYSAEVVDCRVIEHGNAVQITLELGDSEIGDEVIAAVMGVSSA